MADDLFRAAAIDFLRQRDQVVRANLADARDANPDHAARAVALSRPLGIPPAAIESDLPYYEGLQKENESQRLLRENPILTKWLENPYNARIVGNDLPKLAGTESLWRGLADLGRAFAGDAVTSVGAGIAGLGEGAAAADRRLEALGDTFMSPLFPNAAANRERMRKGAAFNWEPSKGLIGLGTPIKEAGDSINVPRERRNLADDVAGGVGQILTQIAAVVTTGGASAFALMFGQGVDAMVDDVKKSGKEGTLAADAALLASGAITGLLEKTGIDLILDRVPPAIKSNILRKITDLAIAGGIEATQEAVEQIAQNALANYHLDTNKSLGEGVIESATPAGIAAALVRAMVGAKGRPNTKQPEADAALLGKMLAAVRDTDLATRSPEKMAEFLGGLPGGDSNAYIPVDAVWSFFQTVEPDEAAKLIETLGIGRQLEQALASGGDVVIPLNQYVAHAPEAMVAAWQDEIRLRASGMSRREAREYEAGDEARAKELGASIAKRAEEEIRLDRARNEVVTRVERMMQAAGESPETARQIATLYGERYLARAARSGLSADDAVKAFARSGLDVQSDLFPASEPVDVPEIADAIAEAQAIVAGEKAAEKAKAKKESKQSASGEPLAPLTPVVAPAAPAPDTEKPPASNPIKGGINEAPPVNTEESKPSIAEPPAAAAPAPAETAETTPPAAASEPAPVATAPVEPTPAPEPAPAPASAPSAPPAENATGAPDPASALFARIPSPNTIDHQFAEALADILDEIRGGATGKLSAATVQDLANRIYGGTLAEGKYTRDQLYDAMELGVNIYIKRHPQRFDATADDVEARAAAGLLERLKDTLPTQTVRAGEKDAYQQFSTPPDYAFAAAWVANMTPADSVIEPSAGLGGLLVHAMNAGVRETTANELSDKRRSMIVALNPTRVTGEDAAQLDNILPADVRPTVVLMNPPFSRAAERMGGKMVLDEGAKHIEQMLARLEPGGRLVAIVGDGMKPVGTEKIGTGRGGTGAAFRDWWKKIGAEYDVRANVGVDRDIYKKYGTSFPTRFLVIDKNPPSGRPLLTGQADDAADLIERLKEIRNDRGSVQQQPAQPASPAVAEGSEGGNQRPAELPRPTGDVGGGTPGVAGTADGAGAGQTRPDNGAGVGDGGRAGAGDGVAAVQPQPVAGGRDGPSTGALAAGGDAAASGGVSAGDDIRYDDSVKPTEVAPLPEDTEAIYEPYKPQRVRIKGAKAHPGALVQSAAMASVLPPATDYQPRIPAALVKSGALSDAQLEAIVYAGHAHSDVMPNGKRRGFFIGDGTGVGKGREIAGILLDNKMQGRTKAIWVSEKRALVNDAKRDWVGLGQPPTEIIDIGKVKAGDAIPGEKGILFASYDTLKSAEQTKVNGEKVKGKTRLDQIVEWLGPDFDGVIAFDEAHALGNSSDDKGERGVKKAAQKALAGVELQNRLPNARVVYVSATGATETKNLAFADRLGLWGEGTPFANREDFIAKVSEGGVAAMELVARDMKALGHYIARNLSYDGVDYDRVEHTLTADQREIYDKLAEGWQTVLQNFEAALETTGATKNGKSTGSRAKSNALGAFWGGHQRFFNQIITSMQMPSVIKGVEADLKAGRQAVLQLVNTNEASQERALEKAKASGSDDIEDLDMTPRDQLMQMVAKSFPVQQMEEYVDEGGNVKSRPAVDSKGEPILNKQAVAARERLLDQLGSLRVPDGPLEMVLNHFGPDKVAEVTGRGQRVVRKPDEKGQIKAQVEKRGGQANIADASMFQDGKKPILIFSEAGGTGRSYHAAIGSGSAKARRSHYLVQGGWRADKAVQGFGRTHRTSQASAPIFHLVTTDLQGQKRFISSIARRLGQLGALTKGERRTGDQGMFGMRDNLESDEAKAALVQFYRDVARGEVEGVSMQDLEKGMGLKMRDENGAMASNLPSMSQFLNRVLSLKVDHQNLVFEAFSERLDGVIERATAEGTLDTGVETYKADKISKASEQVVYTDPRSGAETKHVHLITQHRNNPVGFEATLAGRNKTAGKKPERFVQNVRSGRVFAVTDAGNKTDADGRITSQLRLTSPTDYQLVDSYDLNRDNWKKLTPKEAQTLWDEQVAATPEFRKSDLHVITGAVLPIWDRLGGNPKIYRLQTDEGERMLARVIPATQVQATLSKLGAEATKVTDTPAAIAQKVLDGATATLANDWTIKPSRVSGEQRIEIIGPDFRYGEELARHGVFSERIQYKTRYFIPTEPGKAAAAIEAITKTRPVTSLSGGRSYNQTVEKQTETSAFKRWFGNSKVVDESGEPLVVYKGGPTRAWQDGSEITSFDSPNGPWAGFFTSSREAASRFADAQWQMTANGGQPAGVFPVFVSIQKPLEVDANGRPARDFQIDASVVGGTDSPLREQFLSGDYDGLIVRNTADEGDIFVPRQPKQIKSAVGNRGTFNPDDSRIFEQAPDGGGLIRGNITFTQTAAGEMRSVMTLLKDRNLSTVLHETGHLWLEELHVDAANPNAPAELKADLQKVRDYLGAKGNEPITVEQHEKWARTVEAYLMEGKSPSVALSEPFARFKSWLKAIYRTVLKLNVEINDDMRGVLDRMIATDEAIAEAKTEIGARRLFATADQAGMTEAEFKAYTDSVTRTQDRAEQAVLDKLMAEVKARRTAEWKEEASALRAEVAGMVDSEPAMRAFNYLRGAALPESLSHLEGMPRMRIAREDLAEYGNPVLPKSVPPIDTDKNGSPVADIAEVLGFADGRAMIDALAGFAKEQAALKDAGDKRSVRVSRIDAEVERIMAERHGDMLNDGSIEAEALSALHNEARSDVLAAEVRALSRQTGKPATPFQMARQWAKRAIAEKAIPEVMDLSAYTRAEAKASRLAEQAMIKGDADEALRRKQEQMIAHALWMEARDAKEEIEAGRKRMDRLAGARTIKSMDQDYLEKIHALLERFGIKSPSPRAVTESLRAWADTQIAAGVDIAIPENFLDEAWRKNYDKLTVDEFRGLSDSVKQLAHLGRLAKKIEVDGEKREFEETIAEALATVAATPQRGVSGDDTGLTPLQERLGRVVSGLRSADASFLKMETLLEWLDGDKTGRGIFTRTVFKRIAAAQGREADRLKGLTDQLAAIYAKVPQDQRDRWLDVHSLPGLPKPDGTSKWNKTSIISMALNIGNEGNLDKLLRGYKWDEQTLRDTLNQRLTREEWRFVQDIWDLIETQWPDLAAVHRRVNGVEPPKVERIPVPTPFGTLPGGYYKAAYDRNLSIPAEKIGEKQDTAVAVGQIFPSGMTRPSTRAGATHERTGFAAPIRLSLDLIDQQLKDAAHDIEFREAVLDAHKFLNDNRIRQAIREAVGPEYERQFAPWLHNIAHEWQTDRDGLSFVNRFANVARTNVTIVALGLRISTALAQTAGFANSVQRLGVVHMAEGLKTFSLSPVQQTAFVREKSAEMRNRANSLERDMRAAQLKMQGRSGALNDIRRLSFEGIAFMDAAVSIPTWLGAYSRGLKEGMTDDDAIYYADKMVRDTQGAGAAKDMAAIQRGGPVLKLFTMFYSYFNVLYNRQRGIVRDAQEGHWGSAINQSFFLLVAAPLLGAFLTGQGPEEEEEWAAWAARNTAFGLLAGVPWARDISFAASTAVGGKYYGGAKLSPVESFGNNLLHLAKDGVKLASDEDPSAGVLKNAFNVIGVLTALPLGQVGQTSQFVWDAIIAGSQDPETLGDWLKGLVFGPERK